MQVEIPTYFPIHDFGPLMKGLVIGGLGIFHVFLAQFAIGGGFLMCYFQWLAQTGREPMARRFVHSYFRFLVLVSFVTGALTGVGMWFTTIQISPATIGTMVSEFHWIWATEWLFFCLEIVCGYCFYRYGERLRDRERLMLLILYSVGGWFSLFWINGILSWQLTPGTWLDHGSLWAGFFNPSFWPSLFFRTIVALTLAALIAIVVINSIKRLRREDRHRLISYAANLLIPMALMPALGIWYLITLPPDSRSWILGGSPAMSMFFFVSVGASVLIGGYALLGIFKERLYVNAATGVLLCALAFGATAGGEFVREGARKPYTIREVMYSNSIKPEQVQYLRRYGSVTNDPYPLKNPEQYPHDDLRLGAKVFRFQCSICHTVSGTNGLTHLTSTWSERQMRLNIAQLQRTKPFMPPFAGTATELEALVDYLRWENDERPSAWIPRETRTLLEETSEWMKEAQENE